jgi:hypothetical protein
MTFIINAALEGNLYLRETKYEREGKGYHNKEHHDSYSSNATAITSRD